MSLAGQPLTPWVTSSSITVMIVSNRSALLDQPIVRTLRPDWLA
jgi:hypothetical protein